MGKESFIIHHDSVGILEKLTDEQAGKLFKAICSYSITGEIDCDSMTDLLVHPFVNQLDRDIKKWNNKSSAGKENGKKGGRPAKANESQENPNKPNETQINPNKPVSVSVPVSASASGKVSANEELKKESSKEKKSGQVDKFKNWPGEPDKTLFDDWMTARKKKKAAFTQTAFNGLGRKLTEAVALGLDLNECVQCAAEKGWASFNVEWYFNENPEKRQQVTRPSSEFERPSSGQPEKQRETIGDVECPEDL